MNKMNFFKNTTWGRPSVMQIIFIAVGLILAIASFFFARGLITCWTVTPLPGSPPSSCGTLSSGPGFTLNEEGTPVANNVQELPAAPITVPDSNLPPAWDGASRISVLLIGLDFRDWMAGEGAPRSDTMIVLTI